MKCSQFALSYFFLLVLLFTACAEDDIVSSNDENIDDNPVVEVFSDNFGESVQADFFGKVLDLENNPIENVIIEVSNFSIVTDQNGVFSIKDANVFEHFAFIGASKEGYVKASKTLKPLTSEINYVEIIMLQHNSTATVNANEISEISLNSGSKVILNGNYKRPNGSSYSGAVEVSMHHLESSNSDTYKRMPGALLGSLENNEPVILETYGMVSVNLFSSDGEYLNLADGTTATIELPINPSQISTAPESIPLWYFDDELGYWIKEGEAEKIGDKYIGEVSHFTWWSGCTYDEDVNTCFNLENTSGDAIPSQYFTISKQESGAIVAGGFTSTNGNFCDFLPYNETLIFSTVFTNCDGSETLYEQEIGPFLTTNAQVDVTLNIIDFVSSSVTASILDCDSEMPIDNGYFYFDYNGEAYSYPIGDSTFEFNFLYCIEQPEITLIAYNLDTNTETETINVTLNPGTNDLGVLNTCGSSGNGNEDNNIFQGDVTLSTQEEVDSFGAMAYTKITGNLIIDDDHPEVITNLNMLQDLLVIEGDLRIFYNAELTNLFGLQNLERIEGSLIIHQNFNLSSIEGLQSLEIIGSDFIFYNNDASTNLDGLQNVNTIPGNVYILGNDGMLSLEGLDNLEEIGGKFDLGNSLNYGSLLEKNTQLIDITALGNLTHINDDVRIVEQPMLEDYTGLNALETVNGDFVIHFGGSNPYEINGFDSLINVSGELNISSTKVTDFSGFNNLQTAQKIAINGSYNDSELLSISGFNGCDNTYVQIRTYDNLNSITGFQGIQTSNMIEIEDNNSLQSITGFNNLQNDTVWLVISSNGMLNDISGFSNITSLNYFSISYCPMLQDLNAFSNLNVINGNLSIGAMDGLVDLSGLESVTAIGGAFEVTNIQNLSSFNGLNNLTTINSVLDINNCDSLVDLSGLETLTYIGDYLNVRSNDNLQSLNGLENLLTCDGLRIGVYYNTSSFVSRPNPNLSDFCALQNLLVNGDTSGSYDIIIENNAYNPSVVLIQNGNCSM